MGPNRNFPADLVLFSEEILNEQRHFCAVWKNDCYPQMSGIHSFTPKFVNTCEVDKTLFYQIPATGVQQFL